MVNTMNRERFDSCFSFLCRKRVTPETPVRAVANDKKENVEVDNVEVDNVEMDNVKVDNVKVDDVIKFNFKSIDKMHQKLAQTFSPEIAAKNIVAVSELQVDLFKLKMKETSTLGTKSQIGYPLMMECDKNLRN